MVLLATQIYSLRSILEQLLKSIKKPIFHNAKFDVRVLENETSVRMKPYFDTMLAHHVLNQGAGQHALKPLARRYLGAPEWEKDLSKYTRGGAYYECIPESLLIEYNGWDVYWTYQLYEYLKPLIDADENAQSALLLEMSASDFLLDVERKGFKVDVDYARKLENDMIIDVNNLEAQLKMLVGPTYNPGSWQQTKMFLGSLGHVVTSTNEESLTELKSNTNNSVTATFIDTLLEYRGIKKALKTYVQGALSKADAEDRVHTTFLIHGTTTGRLSSTGPNIQNIPRDKKYRSLYIG
jgi:DNA polymerase I-like protein with 3'-5' exonuclease and polymerase domains